MFQDLHIYIYLSWEEYSNDQLSYLKNLYKVLDIAYMHQCTVYVCRENIDIFTQSCQTLDDYFTESMGNTIELMLENAIIFDKDVFIFDIGFMEDQSYLKYTDIIINNHSLDKQTSLISLYSSYEQKKLLAISSKTTYFPFTVTTTPTVETIINWIATNGIPRNFHTTSKHGENGVSTWQDASPLLCSCLRAQDLLSNAIADINVYKGKLYNFDNEHNTFIEFYYEGNIPQALWHGFHIKTNLWRKRVPNSILKHYGKT